MKLNEIKKQFGVFKYSELSGGAIKIDPAWIQENIIFITLPVIKPKVGIHRAIVPQFAAAIYEIYAKEIGYLIETFDGCWVARHKTWNPERELSIHSWGLAFDFNAKNNQYDTEGNMPMSLIEIFEKWGFEWGGKWKTKDPMHYELKILLP